jgi:hypothetical protein
LLDFQPFLQFLKLKRYILIQFQWKHTCQSR